MIPTLEAVRPLINRAQTILIPNRYPEKGLEALNGLMNTAVTVAMLGRGNLVTDCGRRVVQAPGRDIPGLLTTLFPDAVGITGGEWVAEYDATPDAPPILSTPLGIDLGEVRLIDERPCRFSRRVRECDRTALPVITAFPNLARQTRVFGNPIEPIVISGAVENVARECDMPAMALVSEGATTRALGLSVVGAPILTNVQMCLVAPQGLA